MSGTMVKGFGESHGYVWDPNTLQWVAWGGGISQETSTIFSGTTALVPKFAAIGVAGSGNNSLIAAVASKKIRILSLFLLAAGTVNVYLTSGNGGTALVGNSSTPINLVANTGFVLPFSPTGWNETGVNTALVANLSAAIGVSGVVAYVEV